MSFKSKKEYKEAKSRWNSSALQQRSPAGYQAFLSAEKEYKNSGKSKNDEVKVDKKKDKDGLRESSSFNDKKYRERDEEHRDNLRSMIDKAKSRYRPKELKRLKERKPLTSKDLPDRPEAPKAPKLKLPGGVLTSSKVAKPSGLDGKIKKYSTSRKSNDQLKSTYKSATIDYQKPKRTKPAKPNKFKGSTTYAPGVSTGKAPKQSKPKGAFGLPSTTTAPGVTKKKGTK